MKRIAGIIALSLILLVGCSPNKKADTDKVVIGVVQLADHPSLDATYEGMKRYLDDTLGSDGYVIDYQNAQGDVVTADLITSKFANDKVDLIYAIATNAAQSAQNATEGTDIPVVFNAVTDPVAAGLVDSLEKPGGNVTGVSDLSPLQKQLAIVKEVLPEAKKVGVIYNVGEVNSTVQIEALKAVSGAVGVEIVEKGITNIQDIGVVAKQLSESVDAYYTITDNMVVSGMASLIDVANQNKLPVFASEDGQMDEGILATESLSYDALGYQAGAMIVDILKNDKKPADTSVIVSTETTLYVKEDVVETLGITLPQTILDRQKLR